MGVRSLLPRVTFNRAATAFDLYLVFAKENPHSEAKSCSKASLVFYDEEDAPILRMSTKRPPSGH